jgi:uncharacterized membrane protein YhiD involved in acid resistance
VAAIGMALGGRAYTDALGTTLLVMIILQGLGFLERAVGRRSSYSHLTIHAKPDAGSLEEVESSARRTGLELTRVESRRENVDLVIELELRGPKRLHDQALIAILHLPAVRTVSSGE